MQAGYIGTKKILFWIGIDSYERLYFTKDATFEKSKANVRLFENESEALGLLDAMNSERGWGVRNNIPEILIRLTKKLQSKEHFWTAPLIRRQLDFVEFRRDNKRRCTWAVFVAKTHPQFEFRLRFSLFEYRFDTYLRANPFWTAQDIVENDPFEEKSGRSLDSLLIQLREWTGLEKKVEPFESAVNEGKFTSIGGAFVHTNH